MNRAWFAGLLGILTSALVGLTPARAAEETGLPYQKLIDLYLLDCARKGRKLTMKWVA